MFANTEMPKGFIKIEFKDTKTGKVLETYSFDNLITQRGSIMLAQAAIYGTPLVSHLAIGSGVGTGTSATPEPAKSTGLTLRKEIKRVQVDMVALNTEDTITGGALLVDGTRSNKIIVSSIIGGSENGISFTEAGLFGGVAATQPNSGDMFNWVTFPEVVKFGNIDTAISWTIVFPFK